MQTVVLTPSFVTDARDAGMSDEEMSQIIETIAANPISGDVMEGTGGARKLRHRKTGTGKRGGYRTVHYYAGDDVPVFLLAVFSKGDKDNLSKAERNELAKVLSNLAAEYRKGKRK